MTPDTKKELERLRELNEKRTRGGWYTDYQYVLMDHPQKGYQITICKTNAVPPMSELHADARFIAAAPDMMALIESLVADNERYREALECIVAEARDTTKYEVAIAKQALQHAGES